MRSVKSAARSQQPALVGTVVLALAVVVALLPLVLLLLHALWSVFGVWLLITPLSTTVLVLSAVVARALLEDVRGRKLRRLESQHRLALAERSELAELEAAAGIALLTDGSCTRCGAELLAGARYCSQCRAEVVSPSRPRICPGCATRNLDNAVFCAACGDPFVTPPVVL